MSKDEQSAIPYGTLSIVILQTLNSMGSLHGYAIARRIEQVAGGTSRISQGAIYPALVRLEQRGWVATEWGSSETNRRVKFYSLTRTGRKQLQVEVADWERANALVSRFLGAKP
jgi:transcriptional regulator